MITVLRLSLIIPFTLFVFAPIASGEEDRLLASQGQYRPEGFSGELIPYSLKENKKKAETGQLHSSASLIVTEFREHYYPKAKFQWYQVRGGGRRHIGTRKIDDDTVQELFLNWQSLGDGLYWRFVNGELERTTNVDRFAIIRDTEVANRIKQSLNDRQLVDEQKRVTDVFRYRSRPFITGQRSSKLNFPNADFGKWRYGFMIDGKVFYFTEDGEQAN